MRQQFLGHFNETDEKVAELWKTAIFVFDANVLLNLYRYSDDTRDEFIKLLKNLKSRSWLPEQAAYEFLKNRATVIKDQIGSYKTTQSDIDKLRKSFSGSRAHPFISKDTKDKFDSAVEQINEEMAENKQKQEDLIHKDGIKDQVADLFDGRVGKRYTGDDLAKIFTQGEERYAAKVPPGYKDGGKFQDPKTESDKRSNFGDWIIWKQLMDHATSAGTPIILVTDDRKEDWWEEEYGKTLGPRPELINEFAETSGQKILIYTPDSFLNISKLQLKTKISKNSIDEVEAEHYRREENRKTKKLKKYNFLKDKFNYINREGVISPDRNANPYHVLYSKNIRQDEFKLSERKLMLDSNDNASSDLINDLLNRIEAAKSHENDLIRRVEAMDVEYRDLIEVGDIETAEDIFLQQLSIREELEAVLNRISSLTSQLTYQSERGNLF